MKKLTQLLAVVLLFIFCGIAQQNFDVEKDVQACTVELAELVYG